MQSRRRQPDMSIDFPVSTFRREVRPSLHSHQETLETSPAGILNKRPSETS
jgi:hypothetical protein